MFPSGVLYDRHPAHRRVHHLGGVADARAREAQVQRVQVVDLERHAGAAESRGVRRVGVAEERDTPAAGQVVLSPYAARGVAPDREAQGALVEGAGPRGVGDGEEGERDFLEARHVVQVYPAVGRPPSTSSAETGAAVYAVRFGSDHALGPHLTARYPYGCAQDWG